MACFVVEFIVRLSRTHGRWQTIRFKFLGYQVSYMYCSVLFHGAWRHFYLHILQELRHFAADDAESHLPFDTIFAHDDSELISSQTGSGATPPPGLESKQAASNASQTESGTGWQSCSLTINLAPSRVSSHWRTMPPMNPFGHLVRCWPGAIRSLINPTWLSPCSILSVTEQNMVSLAAATRPITERANIIRWYTFFF